MNSSFVQALLPFLPALIPFSVGLYAWRRRDRSGAPALALLMWTLSAWAVAHALEPGMRSAVARDAVYGAEHAALLIASPLWLAFALQYPGRERWLTRTRVAFVALLPVAAFVLADVMIGPYEPPWAVDTLPDAARMWADLAYRVLLVLVGVTILFPTLASPQWLYGVQGLCLLAGFLSPWTMATAHGLGLLPLTGPAPTAMIFIPTALAFGSAFLWFRLLDLSPVAHDAVVEGMSDGIVVLDPRNRIVDLNPAARRILGRAASGAIGRDFRRVLAAAGALPLEGSRGADLLRRYEEHGRASEEIDLGEGDDLRHYDVALSALYDARGRRAGRLVVLHEITDRKLVVERLDRMAHFDGLTGLPNRASFYERLGQEIARNRRSRGLLALLFLDLDRFKAVNDSLGHDAGDQVLKEVARRLGACVRSYDMVFRLAGDEFTVILPEISEATDAMVIADRIVEELSRPFPLGEDEVRLTTSIGICFYPADGADSATLVKNADAAMYRAKAAGKNRYALFEADALARTAGRLELDRDLIHALDNRELSLYYQPEVGVATGQLLGVEALLRWEHPWRGTVLPADFVPAAEETGLIFAMERWVLCEACRQMRSWQERYPSDPPLKVSVNLSAGHFAHPNLVGEVSQALQETGLPPACLALEIRESVLDGDPASAAITLRVLKDLGVGLTVDDFGAGSSSLAHLKRLPLDTLKIDRSFVSGLEDDRDRELVAAVVSLSRALGLSVIAEGVETARQLMLLREMGCDGVQGHYFAGPLPHQAASAFLVADLYY